jgi:hypothetical protein
MKPLKIAEPTTRFPGLLPILAVVLTLGITRMAQAQTYSLTNTWALSGATQNLDTSADNRGMTYAASSNGTPVNLVIVNNKGTHAIYAYDGGTGAFVTGINSNNLSGGNFSLNKIGVTPAGQFLGANLTTSIAAGTFKIYTWSDWSQGANVGYTSAGGDALLVNLSGKRIGDSFAMTGSGANTLLLYSIGGSNAYALFSTTDGVTFTPTVLTVSSGLPATGSGVQIGYCFYTNNTFMIAPDGGAGKLYLVQYPANFASLASPVAATVIATNSTLPTGNAGNWLDFSYNAAAGLLATHPNASAPISLYGLPSTNFNVLSLLATTNLSFTTSQSVNGNESGDIALAGTNEIYTLDTSAGVQGTTIGFTPAPLPPGINTPPAGGSVFTNLGTFTFHVSATGTPPLTYYWQYNSVSNPATASTVAITTSPAYTINPLTTSASGWYDVIVSNAAGTTNSVAVELTVTTGLTSNPYVTQLWSLPADNSEPYLDTGYNTRGLAFDPFTTNVVVAEHASANIYALNALTGSLNFVLTTPQTGLPQGSIFPVGQVGVADDGVLYVCNVSSYNPNSFTAVPGTSDFAITRFSAISDPSGTNPYTLYSAFTGDPGAYSPGNVGVSSQDRWGDSFAIRGAGASTEILLGTYETIGANEFGTGPGTNVAILTTTDGMNFTPTTIAVTNAPDGFSYLGVAWGTNNTFWAKSPGYDLRQVRYDLSTGIGTVIQDFATTAGNSSLSGICGIGLDNSNNILAGVNVGDTPNDVELFQIPSAGFPPQAYFQDFFATNNPNINGNAATTIKFPYIFSLDANNGIIGLQYSIPLVTFPITSVTKSGNSLTLTWQSVAGHKYQVQYATSLPGAHASGWTNVGPQQTATGATTTYTDTTATSAARYYQVVGQ